jgi:transcription termination factor Rho
VLQRVWLMRRMVSQMVAPPPNGAGMDITAATEAVLTALRRTETNEDFLNSLSEGI